MHNISLYEALLRWSRGDYHFSGTIGHEKLVFNDKLDEVPVFLGVHVNELPRNYVKRTQEAKGFKDDVTEALERFVTERNNGQVIPHELKVLEQILYLARFLPTPEKHLLAYERLIVDGCYLDSLAEKNRQSAKMMAEMFFRAIFSNIDYCYKNKKQECSIGKNSVARVLNKMLSPNAEICYFLPVHALFIFFILCYVEPKNLPEHLSLLKNIDGFRFETFVIPSEISPPYISTYLNNYLTGNDQLTPRGKTYSFQILGQARYLALQKQICPGAKITKLPICSDWGTKEIMMTPHTRKMLSSGKAPQSLSHMHGVTRGERYAEY